MKPFPCTNLRWSPHCWWYPIQIWSNSALNLTILVKDVNLGKIQSPVSLQQRWQWWWWNLHQMISTLLVSSHTNLELHSFEVKYVQYQNMGKLKLNHLHLLKQEDSDDETLTKMKHILYSFWWYSDFLWHITEIWSHLAQKSYVNTLPIQINISEDIDETYTKRCTFYVLSDDTYS